jgi:hypothetical protein
MSSSAFDSHVASEIVREIADALISQVPPACDANADPASVSHPGLAGGAAGIAVFLASYAALFDDRRAREAARSLLESAIAIIPALPNPPSLFLGPPGIGWAVSRLASNLELEGVDDVLRPLDDYLEALLFECDPGVFEDSLLDGLAGLALYFLERPPPSRDRSLERVVELLRMRAIEDEYGLRWVRSMGGMSAPGSEVKNEAPSLAADLGVARGMFGIIGSLKLISRSGFRNSLPSQLAADAERFVSHCRRQQSPLIGALPIAVRSDMDDRPTGLGWCWGEPGFTGVLSGTATDRERALLSGRAHQLAAELSGEAALESHAFVDSSLCHGLAGLAHILWSVARQTRLEKCQIVADAWFARMLRSRQNDFENLAGYTFSWLGSPRALPGFLRGASGVGLSIIARMGGESGWDRLLLLS